jgi:hypothetical protein
MKIIHENIKPCRRLRKGNVPLFPFFLDNRSLLFPEKDRKKGFIV